MGRWRGSGEELIMNGVNTRLELNETEGRGDDTEGLVHICYEVFER